MEIGRDAWIHGNTCGDMYSRVAMCGDVEMYVWMVRKCVRCVEVVLVCVERCVWRWLKMSGDVYRFVEITTPYISTHLHTSQESPQFSTQLHTPPTIFTHLHTAQHIPSLSTTSTHIHSHLCTHLHTFPHHRHTCTISHIRHISTPPPHISSHLHPFSTMSTYVLIATPTLHTSIHIHIPPLMQ